MGTFFSMVGSISFACVRLCEQAPALEEEPALELPDQADLPKWVQRCSQKTHQKLIRSSFPP